MLFIHRSQRYTRHVMSFLALDLLQTLEHTNASARYMFSGKNGHAELWITKGEIKRIEGCSVDSLRQILLQSPVEIWVRPFELDHPTSLNDLKVPIRDLAFEAAAHHDSGKIEMISSRNSSVTPSDIEKYAKAKAKLFPPVKNPPPPAKKPPPPPAKPVSRTVTASYPLHQIAQAIDQTKVIASPINEVQKTQSYHSIRFIQNQPAEKIIGRASICDIMIDDSQVSRQHCEVKFDGTLIHVTDLGSSNGTFVNHEHITETVKAEAHDVIQVGSSICMVSIT